MLGFNNHRDLVPYGERGSLLDSFFGEPFFSTMLSGEMKTDIQQTDGAYHVSVDIPGVEKKDITIQYSNNGTLTIAVRRDEENKVEKEGFLRHERRVGQSSRAFYLPGAKREAISAKYADGVLSVVLPKGGEQANSPQIEIQ